MTTLRADVAELADAQVSEACDGDIVEVQVLSSAPNIYLTQMGEPVNRARFLSLTIRARLTQRPQRMPIILPQEPGARCFAAGVATAARLGYPA